MLGPEDFENGLERIDERKSLSIDRGVGKEVNKRNRWSEGRNQQYLAKL